MRNMRRPDNSDIRSVGTLMLHIMQPGVMYKSPDETDLLNPNKWSAAINDFLMATRNSTTEELLNVSGHMDSYASYRI